MDLTIDIDEDTHETLARRAARAGFDSPEAYARIIIETVVDELESESPEDDVRDRLDDLGYL